MCKDHINTSPYIVSIYSGEGGVQKAIVVADAVFCGLCKPHERPIPLPELK
ncbi:MAG TPA: hypothetical protein VE136_11785 [Anaerolineales bacterium]|nr:hypothetical protein [Anaerolineales bacterium]